MGDNGVLVLLSDVLTQAEKTLWATGRHETAEAYRLAVLQAVEPEMRGIVLEATGREVRATLHSMHHDPDVVAEVFLLKPTDGDGDRSADGEHPLAVDGSTPRYHVDDG